MGSEFFTYPQNAIYLAVVITPQYSDLIDVLLEDFKKVSGIPVQVYSYDVSQYLTGIPLG